MAQRGGPCCSKQAAQRSYALDYIMMGTHIYGVSIPPSRWPKTGGIQKARARWTWHCSASAPCQPGDQPQRKLSFAFSLSTNILCVPGTENPVMHAPPSSCPERLHMTMQGREIISRKVNKNTYIPATKKTRENDRPEADSLCFYSLIYKMGPMIPPVIPTQQDHRDTCAVHCEGG